MTPPLCFAISMTSRMFRVSQSYSRQGCQHQGEGKLLQCMVPDLYIASSNKSSPCLAFNRPLKGWSWHSHAPILQLYFPNDWVIRHTTPLLVTVAYFFLPSDVSWIMRKGQFGSFYHRQKLQHCMKQPSVSPEFEAQFRASSQMHEQCQSVVNNTLAFKRQGFIAINMKSGGPILW